MAALSILGAGFGWRALGRSAVGMVPVGGWAVRAAWRTRSPAALGEAALARLAAGHDLVEARALDKVKPHLESVLSRIGAADS